MTNQDSTDPHTAAARLPSAPFVERVRLACQVWASQTNPNPKSVMALYWGKYLFAFIGGWAFFVSFNAGYPGFTSPLEWAFTTTAFQKAIAWALFYELTGLGCGWGPMTARIKPMTGAYRHFLWPGTTKMPFFRGAPLIGGSQRTWLDVSLYAANQLLLLRALVAPEVTPEMLIGPLVLIAVMGVLDTTIFLAARAEHYWVALTCLVFASGDELWISGCKLVWCFVWFWAATSKINGHFPSVIMVMMNNGPFFPKVLKKRLFVSYPDDLRPSKLAAWMAHMGTVTEYAIPVLLLTSPNEITTALFLCLMAGFHGFIALNNPNGMPIEWNLIMIYGGVFLFGFHPEAGLLALGSMPLLLAFLLFWLVTIPLFGNFVPSKVSFLPSMRYYAGNWAYNVWLIRKGDAVEKLKRLKKAAGTMREQMAAVGLDEEKIEFAQAFSLYARFMHFQGRPLFEALPRAVDDIDEYDWYDGEIMGGMILGWNFGDGHLNGKALLDAIQPRCEFERGELRVVSIESQPIFGRTMAWSIHDAATGLLDEGQTEMSSMRDAPPWPTGSYAEALQPDAPATPEAG